VEKVVLRMLDDAQILKQRDHLGALDVAAKLHAQISREIPNLLFPAIFFISLFNCRIKNWYFFIQYQSSYFIE